jgi:hypothetical protein
MTGLGARRQCGSIISYTLGEVVSGVDPTADEITGRDAITVASPQRTERPA